MALHSLDTERSGQDALQQRLGMGTVGGDHIVHKGLGGKKMLAVIDDSDPALIYGLVSGYSGASNFSQQASSPYHQQGTQVVLGGLAANGAAGSAVQYRFKGSSIAVLGGINSNSGDMRVFIDGVATPGRVPVSCTIGLSGFTGNPIISATATTIPAFGNGNFPASGTLFLNGEIIPYTSMDPNGFYGCTRPANATTHNYNETIYLWDSSIALYNATNFATKQVLYYNPLLEPTEHTILVVADTNTTSGKARVYFDGFITGSLLGASNIFTQLGTVSTPVTFDANGHCDLGSLQSINSDIAQISVMGYTQTNCESSNTTAMGKMGVRYDNIGAPNYYFHNGPVSTTVTMIISFAYIGESI